MKVFIMLSGGVDSSVAAARLVDAGYDVEGVYMQNWSQDNISNFKVREMLKNCNFDEDKVYAKATADYLAIPFKVVNFEREYWDKIIEPFFAGIAKGGMPNPDIWCNRFIKYGVFLEWALANGADFVASGHYARLRREIPNHKFQITDKYQIQKSKDINKSKILNLKSANVNLLRGVDESKDQSYFLSQVPKGKLQYALFPIGHMYKSQVRDEALVRGLPTATRRDSQGICFIGKVPIKQFLKEKFKEKVGEVQFRDGTKIGQHDGVFYYTIGQRISATEIQKSKNNLQKQITLSNLYSDMRQPLYIVGKDIKKNILYADYDEGKPPLWQKKFSATDWNWFENPEENKIYDVEIRYHQQPKSSGKISEIRNPKSEIRNKSNIQNSKILKIENCELKITLQEPVRAVTPEQTVVLSIGETIIGAGKIQY